MKKSWKITIVSIIAAIIIGILVIGICINNIGISNLKLMYTLNTTDKIIITMQEVSDGRYYLTNLKHPGETIKERMNMDGWIYITQDGSSYFFEKEQEQAIVSTKIWHRNYVKIFVNTNIVDIAG